MSKIGQERKNEIIEDGSREFLLGKNIEDVMKDLGPRIERYKLDEAVIEQKIKEETGDVFLKLPKDDKNLSVNYLKTQQLYDDAIERIVKNEDPEKVILDTDEKLEKLGIGEDDRDQVIQKILKSFELPDKEKETADILLKESGETIKLPRLDENYDDAKELKLKKDIGGILPDRDTDMFTDKNYVISKKIDSGPEKFGKKLETTGELIVETQKLSQYIQQVRVCVLTVPLTVRKLDLESQIYKYLSSESQGRFTRIFIFGWEEQVNKRDYKSFNELLEVNAGVEGALLIIRDIKTFNVFAADVLKGVPKNYFLILADGLITKEDLVVVENVSNDMSYLYPEFASFDVNLTPVRDISVITEEDHLDYYKNELAKYYVKPDVGIKESYASMTDQEDVINIGKKILNVNLRGLESLANPGVTLNECLKRSPKFRNLLTRILGNADSRILVKMMPGPYGLESFSYMYSLLKKTIIKPTVLFSTENFESKRIKIRGIPERGPCLVMTDFILTDVLIPKNIDMIFIVGGGEFTDFQTIIDTMKAVNYTIDKYPRRIQIYNFLCQLNNEITETIDDLDYKKFLGNFERLQKNNKNLKSRSVPIILEENTMKVRLESL
tara:strand:+ start:89 stop:1921 length:1833 start_codon:yes stop_codon:yes gene_type:complete